MTPLSWQDVPSKESSPKAHPAVIAQRGSLPFLMGIMGGATVSLFFIGLLAGYGLATMQGGSSGSPSIPSIADAQAPTPLPPAPEPTSTGNLPPVDPKTDHIRGNIGTATVAFIEYSDFECPFCKRHHPTMQQIMQTYGDQVVWVYRHFPLSFHPNAQKAAESSECANELGGNDAFWKFTDGVFELDALSTDAFVTIAKNIGLNETTFKQCLDSGKYAKHVQEDMDGGTKAGVNGTPGNIIVNLKTDENRIVSGAQPFESFKRAIDDLLDS